MEENHSPASPPEGNMFSQPAQQNLPNATTVLILGILSIVFSIWYLSILGVILSIVALVMANKDMALYRSDMAKYTLTSFNNLKAGRICAIIGLTVAIIFFIIIVLLIFGILATMPFWGMID
ncbi:MAG: CCC motif membrane protein [bacterium]